VYKAKLTYFTFHGKYKHEGETEVDSKVEGGRGDKLVCEIFTEIEKLIWEKKTPPGLVSGGDCEYIVLLELPDHPMGYPAMLVPPYMREFMGAVSKMRAER